MYRLTHGSSLYNTCIRARQQEGSCQCLQHSKLLHAYRMCTNPHWCSEWGCCEPPEVEMDNSNLEEPPAKKKTMLCIASPVSPNKMDAICWSYIPPNTKKATAWAVHAFEQWRDQRNKTSNGNALQICWRTRPQTALTTGCRALCGSLTWEQKTVPT